MARKSPSAAPAQRKTTRILRTSDVLLGRGPGMSVFVGNLRFHELCNEHRAEYVATHLRKEKQRIAKVICNKVHQYGGRFLKQESEAEDCDVWYEVDKGVALEKAKQTLREKKTSISTDGTGLECDATSVEQTETLHDAASRMIPPSAQSADDDSLPTESTPAQERVRKRAPVDEVHPLPYLSDTQPHATQSEVEDSALPLARQATEVGTTVSSDGLSMLGSLDQSFGHQALLPRLFESSPHAASRLQLFQTTPFAFQSTLAWNAAHHELLSRAQSTSQTDNGTPLPATVQHQTAHLDGGGEQSSVATPVHSIREEAFPNAGKSTSSSAEEDEIPLMENLPDDAVSESFLSILGIDSSQPRFTDENEAVEKATLTDAEKSSALCDMFGEMCNVAPRQRKRCRTDLDEESIQFLVKQMRLELEKIPEGKKQTLLEAQAKCGAEEFSNARLEKFLRCEGMNAEVSIGIENVTCITVVWKRSANVSLYFLFVC